MKINILTLFPEMFAPIFASMIGRACENKIIEFNIVNIRDYTKDKHNRVDDTPYGGGMGMVMEAQPILDAYSENGFGGKGIYMSPRGEMLSMDMAENLSHEAEITILCGHYEGVDNRVLEKLDMKEISIGDYIITGGELAAMVMIDVVARFIDGVIGNKESVTNESIYSGLLEASQYTKPREYENMQVPEVLLSGNHEEIRLWKFKESLIITKERRPDLFEKFLKENNNFSKKEKKIINDIIEN